MSRGYFVHLREYSLLLIAAQYPFFILYPEPDDPLPGHEEGGYTSRDGAVTIEHASEPITCLPCLYHWITWSIPLVILGSLDVEGRLFHRQVWTYRGS